MEKIKSLIINGLFVGTMFASLPTFADTNNTASATAQTASTQAVSTQKVNFSPIFIGLSDVMGAVKASDSEKSKNLLNNVYQDYQQLTLKPSEDDTLKKQVETAFQTALANPTSENLSALSTDLYAFEKEQNPVDYTAKRKVFAKKIVPAYDKFEQVLQMANPNNVEELRTAYNEFNKTWLAHERVVRNTSMGHYGKIETAMALIRVAIETTPLNVEQIKTQSVALKQAIDSYNTGETVAVAKVEGATLAGGIALLKDGLDAFKTGDNATGQAKLGEFIAMWTSIEGDVSTRNPQLYSKVESQIPIIMATGSKPEQQANLQTIIDELAKINPTAQYTAIDSMLILLREGLEALLIVMALITALNVAKQTRGKKYVYLGVLTGLLASVAGAIALQQLFPAMTSGANREMLEGVVGIVAVVMMIGIGAWLHSKSSVKSWNAYIKKHMGEAMTTGSFISLFGLAFVSVFREGAETILFYVGILPNISMANFLLGIGMALALLAVVAFIMLKTSVKLPIPLLFKILTWIIYFLGFKILGVSLSALQLTNHLSRTVIPSLPAIEWAGFYPTVQTISAQVVYLLVVVAMIVWSKKQEKLV
ncbi:FTR1 family protein [Faucicola mancuniensis]|uniref:FTR1 family iron permease n=1 Tax=Faucicola mancuniensis TaxID=1309795 RepID=UPI0028EFC279|nr:FTR1 family protein [uncultured Moraxella sp.]